MNSMNIGWICPRCGKVNAPWKDACDCVLSISGGCQHELIFDNQMTSAGSVYRCKKCGMTKTVPYSPDKYGSTLLKKDCINITYL